MQILEQPRSRVYTNATASHGGTITVPYITVDAKGHVSAKANRTITLPAAPTNSIRKWQGLQLSYRPQELLTVYLLDGSANITHYGSCSTAAATAAKVVSCQDLL